MRYAHIKVIAVNLKINQIRLAFGIIWDAVSLHSWKRILFSRVFLSTQFIPFQFSYRLMCCVVLCTTMWTAQINFVIVCALRCDNLVKAREREDFDDDYYHFIPIPFHFNEMYFIQRLLFNECLAFFPSQYHFAYGQL